MPQLIEIKIPRHYFRGRIPIRVEMAFGAVIYVRALYADGPPSSQLVMSKTRVAPPKSRTIPQLELCGAHLLAKLITTISETLSVMQIVIVRSY